MADTSSARKLGFISDHETKVDLLRNKAIAATILDIIGSGDPRPLTIGVHGSWGAGKSSVLEMIAEHKFEGEKTLVIRFNGWQFEGFEDAKIALIEGVVDQLMANKTIYAKAKDQILDVVKRIDWLKAAKRAGGLAFTAFTGLPSPDQAMDLAKFALSKVTDIGGLATKENLEAAATGVQDYLKEAEANPTVAKNIREFHAAFEELIEKAGLDRLIVLVDDLDRCLPKTAIETLEAIRLFVMLPKTAFVIGADEAMIRYAVTDHFPQLDSMAQDYPRAYLEKLIQVPFRIPSMGEAETRTYLTLLVVGSMLGESTTQFAALLRKAEEYMSSPWLQKSIGDTEVAEALGDTYSHEVAAAVSMADQIAPILAVGTSGNPRNVKRFLNSLTLRLAVSEARGFGSAIDSRVLAKIMLVEQFASGVFDEIAREVGASPDGISPSLQRLEERCAFQAMEGPTQTSAENDEAPEGAASEAAIAPPPPPDPRIEAWMALDHVASWAGQLPKIGNENLKPYLFVVNDTKNFALLPSALEPHLQELVDKLAKGELSAASALRTVETLILTDRKKVFGELRAITLRSTDWTVKPPVVAGMIQFLTKAPEFESQYLDLLGHLPASKLGQWAASGHDRAVKTPQGKARLGRIIDSWKTTGSDALKAFIRTAART